MVDIDKVHWTPSNQPYCEDCGHQKYTHKIHDRLKDVFPVHYRSGNVLLINADCMEVMKHVREKEFELSCVDPPYGIGESGGNESRNRVATNGYAKKEWDKSAPEPGYFDALQRVSANQVIWGANHFIDAFPFSVNSPCWLVWDKLNGGSDFADCELAWTSFRTAVRRFSFKWAGMLQGDMKNKERRIHPTQKPVKLYQWIYANYAKPTDRILDTHLGSGSSAIAAHYAGLEFVGIELDPDYYDAAVERFNRETSQMDMFAEKAHES